MEIINLAPIAGVALELILAALGVFGIWALNALKNKFNIETNEKHDKILTEAIEYGFGFAVNRLTKDGKNLTVETENEFVANVVNYVSKGAPKAIRELGLTEERLAELVAARLAGKVPKDNAEAEAN